MRDEQKIFPLIGEVSASIFPLAQDIMGSVFEANFTEQRFYPLTFMAYNVSPKPVSVKLFCKRTPYTNPGAVEGNLADAAEAGYLEPDGKGGYLASEKGRKAIDSVHDTFYARINKVNQFPSDLVKGLAELLTKLVDATTRVNFSSGITCFEISHFGHPKVEPDSLAHVDQLLDDLNAFRDDAHIAAWTPIGMDGHTWETLTFVWNGEANTAEKLAERLPFRNYNAQDFAKTLDDLTNRGWIKLDEDGYQITGEGKNIRDDAEAATDANYGIPWKALTDDELSRLEKLLTDLKETNQKLIEENQDE